MKMRWTAPPLPPDAIRLGEQMNALARAERMRRASLVEAAIIRLAEHGQRVELVEHHAPACGIDTHVNLIVAGDVAETVRF